MKLLILLFSVVLLGTPLRGQETSALSFDEVMALVRDNLPDVSEDELKRLAALGLIRELGARVELVNTNTPPPAASGALVTRKAMYQQDYGYVRLANVAAGAADAFVQAYQALSSTNQLKGLVLDLRFATGQDYETAAKVADAFVKGGHLLLKFGGQELRSTDQDPVINLPVVVLVNQETAGAAEAIAGMIRENGAGLVIGSPTAGEARLFESFTLTSGQTLRIGKIPVLLSTGEPIPAEGLAPDLEVQVSLEDERIFFEDPWKPLPRGLADRGSTNIVANASNRFVRRMNEAELVRRHREGIATDLAEETGAVPITPVIMDPALARGLDFLKGISALQQNRRL